MRCRMALTLHEIQVKNPNIKNIFESMEYGTITENIDLAKAWISDNDFPKGTCPKDLNAWLSKVTTNFKWFETSSLEKCFALERFAKEIENNSELICQLEIVGRGILAKDTKLKSLPLLIDYLQFYTRCPVDALENAGTTLSIIDDNCFLGLLGSVLGPALIAGYNIILHTEPTIDKVVSLLIQLAEKAGIPKGTLSQLTETVDIQTILNERKMNVVSFPGNLNVARFKDLKVVTPTKIVGVGKGNSPMIVFSTADLDSACDSIADAAWGYGSLLPWRLRTILIQEDVLDTFTDKLKDRLSKIKIGSVFDKLTDLICPSEAFSIENYQKALLAAKTYGIDTFPTNSIDGEFQPTILIKGRVSVNNVILEDGDSLVVSVTAFRTTNEAVNLANNTRNGIGVSVWTENIGLINEIIQKLNFSNVWVNSFGIFSASSSFSPYKDSGIGYIGGEEGLCEYLSCIPPNQSKRRILDHADVQSEAMQSFYGGLFRKSESGLRDGAFDVPIAKDLLNALSAARKGHEAWKKETIQNRNQILKQFAKQLHSKIMFLREVAKIPEEATLSWIKLTYRAPSQLLKTESVTKNKGLSLQTVLDSVGIIVVDEGNEIEDTFLCIISSLLFGNSVILFNYNKSFARFYVEFCKLLSSVKFPAGVFNVILNCNEEFVKNVSFHKEITAHFVLTNTHASYSLKDFKQVCVPMNKWSHSFRTRKIKNVWTNVGDSVL